MTRTVQVDLRGVRVSVELAKAAKALAQGGAS